MKLHQTLAALGATLVLSACLPSFAATQSDKQAEVRAAVAASLEKIYKVQPRIKAEVAAAPGYAVFTTYGVSFVFGGAGGTGMAHDQQSGKDTYMSVAQATAGLQAGMSERDT